MVRLLFVGVVGVDLLLGVSKVIYLGLIISYNRIKIDFKKVAIIII